jgi:Fe-S-cluster containining protein
VSPADQAVLREGLNALDRAKLGWIIQEAVRQSRLAGESVSDHEEMREPCPLLEHEECLVYDHRPLACRLYGAAESGRGAIYGCDAVRLRLAFTGDRLVNIRTVTAPFELRKDARPELSLIDWLAGLRGGNHGRAD